LLSFCWRYKGFLANSGKVTIAQLNTIGGGPSVIFALNEFKLGFIAFIGKDRADFARGFKFCMLIICVTAKDLNFFKKAVQLKRAVYIKADLVKANCDLLFAFFFLFFVMFLFIMVIIFVLVMAVTFFFAVAMTAGNAIIRVKFVNGKAKKAAFSNIRGTAR